MEIFAANPKSGNSANLDSKGDEKHAYFFAFFTLSTFLLCVCMRKQKKVKRGFIRNRRALELLNIWYFVPEIRMVIVLQISFPRNIQQILDALFQVNANYQMIPFYDKRYEIECMYSRLHFMMTNYFLPQEQFYILYIIFCVCLHGGKNIV